MNIHSLPVKRQARCFMHVTLYKFGSRFYAHFTEGDKGGLEGLGELPF